jgi:hypothetical protein
MNDQQKKGQYSGVRDQEIGAALDQHWAASDANDFEMEQRIYHDDAVLEYPQSGELTRGRSNIQNQRASQPSKKRFAVRRIIGSRDLGVTEFILTYDGKPSYTVSIMEFRDAKVARETQYFADPFVAPASRAQWVERNGHIISPLREQASEDDVSTARGDDHEIHCDKHRVVAPTIRP